MAERKFRLVDVRFILKALSAPDLTNQGNHHYTDSEILDLCEALMDQGFLIRSARFILKKRNILSYGLTPKGSELYDKLKEHTAFEEQRSMYSDGLTADDIDTLHFTLTREKKARKKRVKNTDKESQDTVPVQESSQSKIPNPVHDAAFDWAMKYRKAHPDFRFWLRRKNTNKRLHRGFWFQGTENYASMGLYNLRSNNLSTKAVALVFWPYKGGIGASFELIFRGKQNLANMAFYGAIQDLLREERGFEEPLKATNRNRARMVLSFTQPFEATGRFLDRYKEKMDSLLARHGLQQAMISEEDFNRSLNRVTDYREQLLKDPHAFDEAEEEKEENLTEDQLEDETGTDKLLEGTYDESATGSVQSHKRMAELTIMGKNGQPLLGVEELARVFTDVLIRSTEQSSSTAEEDHFYGIFGRWGRGKTYLWELIEKRIREHPDYAGKYETVPFHAWKYQQTPAIWAYLYETLASRYYKEVKGSWWTRGRLLIGNRWRAFRLNTERDFEQVLLSILGIAGLIISATLGLLVPSFCLPGWLVWGLPGISALSLGGGLYKMIRDPLSKKGRSFVEKYSKRPTYNKEMGIQHEIQEELRHLLKVWHKQSKKKFVLFIDDIDRCSHERIISIVDSIRVILNDSAIRAHIIVIAAIDEHILYNAIRMKYEPFVEDKAMLRRITMEYFDKLFIAGIRLGALTDVQKVAVLRGITRGITETQETEKAKGQRQEKPEADAKAGLGTAMSQEQRALANKLSRAIGEPQRPSDSGSLPDEEANTGAGANEQTKGAEELSPFQLSAEEQTMLAEAVKLLENATPRSIRNFTIKYRLARSMVRLRLLEKDRLVENETGETSMIRQWNTEMRYKQALVDYILESMNEKSGAPRDIPEDMDGYLIEAATIVSFNPQQKQGGPSVT